MSQISRPSFLMMENPCLLLTGLLYNTPFQKGSYPEYPGASCSIAASIIVIFPASLWPCQNHNDLGKITKILRESKWPFRHHNNPVTITRSYQPHNHTTCQPFNDHLILLASNDLSALNHASTIVFFSAIKWSFQHHSQHHNDLASIKASIIIIMPAFQWSCQHHYHLG